jgi:ribosomal-protein-alanine N-acetyltransferase
MAELTTIQLETSRLYLKPLTFDQLILYKDHDLSLATELDLVPEYDEVVKEFVVIIESCNIPYVQFNADKILFGTLWVLIHKADKAIIGDISFKGAPSDQGLVEVGYGVAAKYRNKGYMSEALHAFTIWAFEQPQVKIIVAETDKTNVASQKTLSKLNFQPFAETDSNYWWRLDKEVNLPVTHLE